MEVFVKILETQILYTIILSIPWSYEASEEGISRLSSWRHLQTFSASQPKRKIEGNDFKVSFLENQIRT